MHRATSNPVSARSMVAALLLLVSGVCVFAVTKGPDAKGYTATDQTVYSFMDISGVGTGTSVLQGTDDGVVPLTLPFSFQFYGQPYTMVCVSSNGALYLINNANGCGAPNDFANTDLTVASPPNDPPALLPFWTDLTFQVPGAGSVFYQTLGTAGKRRFVVQWNNAFPQRSQTPVNFEVVLFESTNSILFQYQNVNLGQGDPNSSGAHATVGIHNSGGLQSGQQIAWSYDAPVLTDNSAIQFSNTPVQQTPTINWPTPAAIVYGTPLSTAQLNATASFAGSAIAGTFTYNPPAGTVLHVGVNSLIVSFVPADSAGFSSGTASTTIIVNPVALNVIADNAARPFGFANPILGATYSGLVNGDTFASAVTGTPAVSTTATTLSPVGTYPVAVTQGTLAAPNYVFNFVNGTLRVTKATTTASLTSSLQPVTVGQTVSFTATVNPAAAGAPTGTVSFKDGSTTLGSSALSAGQSTLSIASLSVGAHSITGTYGGDTNFNQSSSAALVENVQYNVCLLYDPTRSVNSGAVIPIKIQLCDISGKDLSLPSVVLHATGLTSVSGLSEPATAVGNANPDNDFRFDPTLGATGGYIFNLSTKGLSPGTYALQFTATGDPIIHVVSFGVR